jgi:hypothetical protein
MKTLKAQKARICIHWRVQTVLMEWGAFIVKEMRSPAHPFMPRAVVQIRKGLLRQKHESDAQSRRGQNGKNIELGGGGLRTGILGHLIASGVVRSSETT